MAMRLGTEERPLRVAVVGSGPSGFYAIGALLKQQDLVVRVDLFDRLPTPYGLVRGGVAPDHQKIKNVIRVYEKTASDDRFRFFGNVHVGSDVTLEDLTPCYDQIVFAVGNESDRRMGIEGEDLAGVYSATEFVGWYNAHPDFRDRDFDLASARRVAVVGNGNVAMDVTRLLAQDPDLLASTDIADYALEALRESGVEEILLLGRRGPAQAAFSPKEIKEVGSLESADLVVAPEEVDLDEVSRRWLEEQAPPSARKNVEYLEERSRAGEGTGRRKIRCRFLVSPVRLLERNGGLGAVELERNELYAAEDGTPRPRGTGEVETVEVDLLFKAVGYRGVPVEGLPFDERYGVLPNREGRLIDPDSAEPLPGLYVVGWAKRGPSGLIGTNGPDAQATVARMIEDVEGGLEGCGPEPAQITQVLEGRAVDFVSFEDWKRLDSEELRRGEAKGKVREKYCRVEEMMEAIRRLRGESGEAGTA